MKKQIARLSPHQNGKVFGIMMAVSSLPIAILSLIMFGLFAPKGLSPENEKSLPVIMFAVFPFVYLIMGYLFVVIGCFIYNVLYKYFGGFEFEVSEPEQSQS